MRCSLFTFLLLFSYCLANGQDKLLYSSHVLDSLDRIAPAYSNIRRFTRCPYVLRVRTQAQFDQIGADIKKAIETGRENIKVKIYKGVYHFNENHIALGKGDYDNTSILIEGRRAIITSDKKYNISSLPVSPWTDLQYADSIIEVADVDQKICMIPYKNNFTESEKQRYTKVQISQWYLAPIYNITQIDSNGIYFLASEIKYLESFGRKGYTINYDYLYSGKPPRVRLYDSSLERENTASTFLRLGFCSLKYIEVSGIHFWGNKKKDSVFEINKVKANQIKVNNCSFESLEGNVLSAVMTDNITLENCIIHNTSGNEVSFASGCRNVRVQNCIFQNCNLDLSNSFCVRCDEGEYYIANNSFRDFGYCAIGVGLWYGHEKHFEAKGIIEHNEIFFSPYYARNKEKHTLMDGGAIYICTQNDDAIIRYNFIHDYVGMRSYSGIYCDDGASNCKIYGNIILNTPNGCSILSHRVSDHKSVSCNNSNNFIANNMFDGAIIFEGYGTEERHCVKGSNIILRNEVKQQYSSRLRYLEKEEDDIEVLDWSYNGYSLSIPLSFHEIQLKAGLKSK